MVETTQIDLVVNGSAESVVTDPLRPLADVLREELGLTGTKLGCRTGDCGTCTVQVDGVAKTSCLIPVAQIANSSVTTVEGLAVDGELHPVQAAFAAHNASQCGYCIPGLLMTAATLHAKNEPLTRAEIVAELTGNLCRCTGYESVIDAIVDACARNQAGEAPA